MLRGEALVSQHELDHPRNRFRNRNRLRLTRLSPPRFLSETSGLHYLGLVNRRGR